jgi:uncharacterized membrane protein YqjE
MESTPGSLRQLATSVKKFARLLVTIGENRLELLTVEAREERELILDAFLLGLGVAVFGLFAGLSLTAALVVWLWASSPVALLLTLTALYGAVGVGLYWRLARLRVNWHTFPASIDQLQKDRADLEKILA